MASQEYVFNFPERTVKSITVEPYRYQPNTAEYFEASRVEQSDTAATLWSKYSPYMSTNTSAGDFTYSRRGIGTDTATIPLDVDMGLNADRLLDITDTCGDRCNDGVRGYRIYTPVLFTIELDSSLTVQYYTTTGKSLKAIFPTHKEEMKPGQKYSFKPPENEKYEYVGYKKSTTGETPKGEIVEGEPPAFTYTGSFENYKAIQYYKEKSTVLCKPGETSATNPDCDDEDKETDPGEGICTWTIDSSTTASKMEKAFMDPQAQGHILADDRVNDRHFDVTRGIPTSENLYANTWSYPYLFQHVFNNRKGQITYDCHMEVTYKLVWYEKRKDKPDRKRTDTKDVQYQFSFQRPYDYWDIGKLEVLDIQKAIMNNYALPGGTVTLGANYTPPQMELLHYEKVQDHVKPANTARFTYKPEPVDKGGHSKPSPPDDTGKLRNMAESHTSDPKVRNDQIKFTFEHKDTDVMNGNWVTKTAPAPKEIPTPTKIHSYKDSGEKVLYKGAQLISSKLVNKASTSSSGTIFYSMLSENVQGSGNKNFPIQNINTVTVHTPVVDYASISDDKAHNQKTVPNPSRMALILDRPFTVRIPTTGQHLDGSTYPGYGSREYAKYFKTKQVQFPFDVYDQQRKHFYPRNTWIDVPVSQLDTVFVLPVWVDEGDYTVYFRNIAENAPTGFTTQPDANTNLTHHVATDTVAVEVIGRLYDFHVTDIADFNWESVFRQSSGSRQPTGKSFWVGTGSIDGAARGNTAPYTLPIIRGSHPLSGYKNVAVKTGYHFKFDLKTKGNMFGDKDGIRITPTFFYQDKDAATAPERVPVDLYYHTDERKFIRIGSSQDTERRMVTLNQRLRNVPAQDLIDTAAAIYELSTGWTQSKAQYIAAFQKRANQTTYTGGYDIQLLPSPLRTFIQSAEQRPENASASPARVTASVQQWYGEYSLPAQVYVVPGGTDLAAYGRSHVLDEKSPVFLKNGYITVNFDIESIVNADTQHPHLQYIHARLSNQWWSMEGYDNTDGSRDHFVTDPYQVKYRVEDGDVLFYDTDQSSYSDFTSRGTH
ncbi:DUF5704 domain-containing protein [Paenibacillus sp. Z6-24]